MPLLFYITDRSAFPGDESTRRRLLLEKISEAARAGIDYIQLREKDLCARELEELARQAIEVVAETKKLATDHRPLTTALLINSRTDVAFASGAAGVHLLSNDISPAEVKEIWKCASLCGAGAPSASSGQAPAREAIISISCHSPKEVAQAAANDANFAVFAPIFEKKDEPSIPSAGLALLREACRAEIPVVALGGITLENARSCLDAGAVGIAAIRLFQDNDMAEVVRELRG